MHPCLVPIPTLDCHDNCLNIAIICHFHCGSWHRRYALFGTLDLVGLDTLGTICGRNFTDIANLAELLATNLGILKTSAHDTIDVLQCDRRMTIYTTTVYDGTCTYSIQRSYMDIACTYMGDWVVFRDFRARPWNCCELNLYPPFSHSLCRSCSSHRLHGHVYDYGSIGLCGC